MYSTRKTWGESTLPGSSRVGPSSMLRKAALARDMDHLPASPDRHTASPERHCTERTPVSPPRRRSTWL